MITLSGFKSITLVNGNDLTEGNSVIKEPMNNNIIYEYNKKSTVKTVANDLIIVTIEDKANTLKFDDGYQQATRAKNENKPAYSTASYTRPTVITKPSGVSISQTAPEPEPPVEFI